MMLIGKTVLNFLNSRKSYRQKSHGDTVWNSLWFKRRWPEQWQLGIWRDHMSSWQVQNLFGHLTQILYLSG